MNNIIYNISLILLSLGFILMVIYITIVLTKKSDCVCNDKLDNTNKPETSTNTIYDDRPSITYVKMFTQPEVGFVYQDFDANDNSNSAFFTSKSNN